MSTLVLASQSPRRREILATLGIPFVVDVADVDESTVLGEAPAAYVERLARAKAAAVAARRANAWVLGADTTVVVADAILGKPADDADAVRMLTELSGHTHTVWTGIAAVRGATVASRAVATLVTFRALTEREIAGYVASREGRDKAGSYGIQGLGMGLVRGIDGSYTNVVGLPAAETVELLVEVGALASWPLERANEVRT